MYPRSWTSFALPVEQTATVSPKSPCWKNDNSPLKRSGDDTSIQAGHFLPAKDRTILRNIPRGSLFKIPLQPDTFYSKHRHSKQIHFDPKFSHMQTSFCILGPSLAGFLGRSSATGFVKRRSSSWTRARRSFGRPSVRGSLQRLLHGPAFSFSEGVLLKTKIYNNVLFLV